MEVRLGGWWCKLNLHFAEEKSGKTIFKIQYKKLIKKIKLEKKFYKSWLEVILECLLKDANILKSIEGKDLIHINWNIHF